MYILMKYKSDFKKYFKCKNMLFVICLIDFCHKNDLNYKLNILGPLCLWQCFIMRVRDGYAAVFADAQ